MTLLDTCHQTIILYNKISKWEWKSLGGPTPVGLKSKDFYPTGVGGQLFLGQNTKLVVRCLIKDTRLQPFFFKKLFLSHTLDFLNNLNGTHHSSSWPQKMLRNLKFSKISQWPNRRSKLWGVVLYKVFTTFKARLKEYKFEDGASKLLKLFWNTYERHKYSKYSLRI